MNTHSRLGAEARSTRRRSRSRTPIVRRTAARLSIEHLESRALLAAVVSDALNFSTAEQSLWAPGTDAVAGGEFEYVHTVIPESAPGFTAGSISHVNNPLADAWDAAVVACQTVLPNVLGLDDNCPSYVQNGFSIDPPAFDPITIPGVGPRPPETVPSGTRLSVDGALGIGLSGSLDVTAGSVNVDYPTTATVEVLDTPILPGETFTIRTSETPGSANMSTAFSEIDASIRGIIDASASVDLDQYTLGVHTIDIDEGFDTGRFSHEIVGTTIGTDSIELRPLGQPAEIHLSPVGKNISIPALPPPFAAYAGFPLADVQVLFPDLDTPPNGTFDDGVITNSRLPVTRSGDGITPIDFAKVDLDVDSLSLLAGWPLGIQVGVPLTSTFEINLIDTDLGAFLGIGQTMTFDADLAVDLHFSTPTQVETSPGEFQTLSVYRAAVGEDVNAVHPGGDLRIDPVYSVADNVFTNVTDMLLSPSFTASFLQLKVAGVLNSLLGISGDFHVFQETLAIGDPLPVASIFDGQFSLQGFENVAGSSLAVPSFVPPVIDDASLVVEPVSPLEGSSVAFSGAFSDLNVDEGHVASIDWGDGSPLTNLAIAAGDAKIFSAEHTYADDRSYTIEVNVTDDADMSDDADPFTVAVGNVDPSLSLTGSSLNLDADGVPVPFSGVRGQTLHFAGVVSDPGFDNPAASPATHETFTYVIDWGDGTTTAPAAVSVHTVGSPGADTAGSFGNRHIYEEEGTYLIRISVEDDDGGTTEVTEQVTIEVAAIQVGGDLAVGGTMGDDHLILRSHPRKDELRLRVDRQWLGPFAPTERLLAFGQDGDDRILVVGRSNIPAWLDGGHGDDYLMGGNEDDVLLGGPGDDLLVGGGGRNLLVGGDGADRLLGGTRDDLLVAGSLQFDNRDAAISAVMEEWTSAREYETRVANLSGVDEDHGNPAYGDRANDDFFLELGESVIEDSDDDWLLGLTGQDWHFFDSSLDRAIGVRSDEVIGTPA